MDSSFCNGFTLVDMHQCSSPTALLVVSERDTKTMGVELSAYCKSHVRLLMP